MQKKKDKNKFKREKKKAAKAAAKKKDVDGGAEAAPAPAPAPAPTPQAPEPAPEDPVGTSTFDPSKMTLADAAKMSQMLKTFAAATMVGLGESMPDEQMPESADVNEINMPHAANATNAYGEKNDSKPAGVFKHLMQAYEKSISKPEKADVQSMHTVADAESLRTNAGLYTPK